MEHLLCDEGLGSLFLLEERRLRGDLITISKHLKCRSHVDGCGLSLVVSSSRTRGIELKFHTDARKNFCALRVTECWNRLSREVEESPV